MSSNLFSDLGGTNIRSQRWTKSSLRPTATAYQKHWEPSKKAEIAWLDARWHPTFLERQGLIWLVPIKKQFFLVRDFRRGERFTNKIQKSWWKVFRSLELESFIIWNGTSQIISKKHENSVSTQEDFCIDSKQRNPEKVENQRSITLFQTGIPRGSKL